MSVPRLAYLFVPMCLAWPLQVAHSVLDRGRRETMKWFGWAMLFGLTREILLANTHPVYRFPVGVSSGIAVPVAIGWTFALYVGEMVAGGFVKDLGPDEKPWFLPESMKAGIAAGVTASVALPIEAVAVGMGWWSWHPAVSARGWMAIPVLTDVPLFVVPGWAWSSFVFVLVYDFINDPARAERYGNRRFLMLLLIGGHLAGLVYGNWLFLNAWSLR